jgi:hypothetical protein
VTDMSYMFFDASAFNADITLWNSEALIYAVDMFRGANAWKTVYKRVDGSTAVNGPPNEWTLL